ncbi:hypothetical protein QVD17_12660 [Tagetes erecta]|uniref:Uncharacterized protein n=1 Tax=Tagetes erecta TaxID=13708 RepID=A0AAD8P307_TARER|nr:hypothetical protein QVD17_12660 [Tagetes erecta]
MGGHNSQRKSSFSFFGIFKHKKSHKVGWEDTWDDSMKAYKVYPSDQDRAGRWADPRIDSKASVYIDTITNRWNHVEVTLEFDFEIGLDVHTLKNVYFFSNTQFLHATIL